MSELAEVKAVLDSMNAAKAPTLAQRVRDTIEHEKLVADVCIWDAEKREQSIRAQCVYWMEMALGAA